MDKDEWGEGEDGDNSYLHDVNALVTKAQPLLANDGQTRDVKSGRDNDRLCVCVCVCVCVCDCVYVCKNVHVLVDRRK